MIAKGRHVVKGPYRPARGERHGRRKLSAAEVLEIRRRYALGGVTQVSLGHEYGVSGAHICGIVNGRFWTEGVPALPARAG
jgi:hypothetical protein